MAHLKSTPPPSYYVKPRDITDDRQKGGRLVPVFPSMLQGTQKEEDYISRMVRKDKEANFG